MAIDGMFSVAASGFKYGRIRFAQRKERTSTVPELTHDGDTLSVYSPANLGTRFLGVDSPEISFDLPGRYGFRSLSDPLWDAFFKGPEMAQRLEKFSAPLADHFRTIIGDGTDVSANHYRHADAARQHLRMEIQRDLIASGRAPADFELFLAYGYEFLDAYGRLLCYVRPHRDNFAADPPPSAGVDYNIRQLAGGYAVPFFIFPNVDPFLRIYNPLDKKIVQPESFWKIFSKAGKLRGAREAVQQARLLQTGIYHPADPLRLLPMELRTLVKGSKPNRYVIDLSRPGNNVLLTPERYFEIPNPEDRLYLPEMFADYFQMSGWVVYGEAG